MIHLETESIRLDVRPEDGACIWSMDFVAASGWQPVLLPESGKAEGALHSGLFWMLPFANRARQNRLHGFEIMPNTPEPLALHGTAWSRAWAVEETDASSARLSLSCGYAETPYPLSAGLEFQLEGTIFRAHVWVRNEADQSVPAGLGAHPYFPSLPQTTLQFEATWFYLEGPDHLPTDAITLPPELDFCNEARLPGSWRNNAYGGWTGLARIRQPDLGYQVVLQAQAGMRELMLYTAPGLSRFALEPQTHTSGATLEMSPDPQVGLSVLQPGQVLSGDFSLTLSRL